MTHPNEKAAGAGAQNGGVNRAKHHSADRIDRDEIINATRLLIAPGGITELRALDATLNGSRFVSTVSGYFDSSEKLADAAASITSAKGIYIIPNAVCSDLLARASNRVRIVTKSDPLTGDLDIVRRHWLLIDVDAIRPAGISANDEERAAAYAKVVIIVRCLLIEFGWPDPIVADSGNGNHLLYRIDLPADDGGLVQRCLTALATRFDDDRVKVDITVHNPARIWKLYGTLACKGDSTQDRPHRMARLLQVPANVELVSQAKLLGLGGLGEPKMLTNSEPAHGKQVSAIGNFDLHSWICQHLVNVEGPKPWKSGGKMWTLAVCPFNADHVGGCAYVGQQPSGPIVAGCHHNSCDWNWDDLRARFEPPKQRSREQRRQSNGQSEPVLICLEDVKPEPLRWLWPGRIPSGKLVLICGDPNGGKTFLTLDMAARVSIGRPWPDRRDETNEAGDVLLLSAEDDPADTIVPRLMAAGADLNRIRMIQGVKRNGSGKASFFSLAMDVAALERVAETMSNLRLIVIDPVSAYMGGDTDSHKNADVRGVLGPLAELASKRNIAIVVVTHLSKGAGGKAMYRAIGSIAFIAAARAAWAVVRDPNDETLRRRGMLPIKLNIAAEASGIAYSIEPATVNGIDTAALHWESEPLDVKADEWIAAEMASGDEADRTARQSAAEWLRLALSDGELPSEELHSQARKNGISHATLRRAMGDVGVKPRKVGFGKGAQWVCALPDGLKVLKGNEDAHRSELNTFDEIEHLRKGDEP